MLTQLLLRGVALSMAALGWLAIPGIAAGQSRADCYTPTLIDGMPLQFVWRPSGDGDIANPDNYFPMCFARKEPPPGDPIGGPPIYFTPSAADTIVVFDRNKPGFGEPGEEPGPVVGTITSGGGTYAGLGILAFDNLIGDRSDITFTVGGVLNLTDGFSGFGVRDGSGNANLRITGSAITTPVVSLTDAAVQGSIAVSSEKPTSGFVIAAPEVRLFDRVTAWDAFVGFGAGSTGTLTLNPGATLALDGSARLMFVGFGGTGTVDVGANALVQSAGLFVGTQTGSSGTVSVHDGGRIEATLTPEARMEIGRRGTADVTIGPGSEINVGSEIQIGSEVGGNGFLRVDAGGALTTRAFGLRIGGLDQGTGTGGTGALVVNGGTVDLGGRALIGAAEGGQGSVEITGGSMTLKERIVVGHAGEGSLKLSGDGQLKITTPLDGEGLRIGRWATGKGTVEFSGPDARVEGLGNSVVVGLLGDGTLKIADGFKLDLDLGKLALGQEAGAKGTLIVDGLGSEVSTQTLLVGDLGRGDVRVSGGGSLQTEGAARIGEGAGPAGRISTVTIEGAGSRWEIGSDTSSLDLKLGGASEAQVLIKSGGVLKLNGTAGVVIAQDSGSTGLLRFDGAGSRLEASTAGGGIVIGDAGTARLEVGGGATLSLPVQVGGPLALGKAASADATMLVEGAGSRLTVDGSMTLGVAGRAAIDLRSGGAFETRDTLLVGQNAGAEGAISVDGAGSTFTLAGTRAKLGVAGDGRLAVTNGGVASLRGALGFGFAPTTLGAEAGGQGTITVTGAGSRVNTGALNVGDLGRGLVTITSGGALESSGDLRIGGVGGDARGSVEVGGDGSSLKVVGLVVGTNSSLAFGDTPSLTVADRALLQTTGTAEIGTAAAGGSGLVRVTSDAEWRADGARIAVGNPAHGSGRLEIDGGRVTSYQIDVTGAGLDVTGGGKLEAFVLNVAEPAAFGESTATVTGGSTLSVFSEATVKGGAGGGKLRLDGASQTTIRDLRQLDGSRVEVSGDGTQLAVTGGATLEGGVLRIEDRGRAEINRLTMTDGSVQVVGIGSLDVAGDLTARALSVSGDAGLRVGGTLKLQSGSGLMTVDGAVTTLNSRVLETGAGSHANFTGNASVRVASSVVNQGTLDMRGGMMIVGSFSAQPGDLVNGDIVVGSDGAFSGSGNVVGRLLRVGAGGTLAPGSSPGTLTLDGDLVIEDGGRLAIEIAGLEGALHDLIEVTGDLIIGDGALLDLRFLDGFAPDLGDIVDFISYGGRVTGSFSSIAVSGLADGWDYSVGLTGSGGFRLNSLSDAVASAPTPGTLALSMIALGLVAVARSRGGQRA